MRTPLVEWFGRFDQPCSTQLLIFDFGAGPMLGTYLDGQFLCLKDPQQHWDRVLVNKWRYCDANERRADQARSAAA